jgi:hypothetical protein
MNDNRSDERFRLPALLAAAATTLWAERAVLAPQQAVPPVGSKPPGFLASCFIGGRWLSQSARVLI